MAEFSKKEREQNIFSPKKFHIVHALVLVEIRVFKKPIFVSCVPTHTSTWNQGIDVEDFGILNTKLGARTVRGQRIQVIIRVVLQVFFG